MNSVVFTVRATDADNDKIIYSIDHTSVRSTISLQYTNPLQYSLYIVMYIVMYCVCVCVIQPDAEYFKIDLPSSGEVILSKSLDYETKTQLNVTIHAMVSYIHSFFFLSLSKLLH